MRTRALILVTVWCFWVCALGSQQDVKHAIQAQYNRWSKAYMANDADTLLKILSPDYTLTSIDKETLTYGIYKAYLLLKAKGPKDTTRYSTFIRKLTEKNGDAEVDSVETMITRKADKTGRSVLTTHRHVYSDEWRLSGGEWLLCRTVTLKESTKIDR